MHEVSLWEEESFYGPQDFIIAGAGFAGLWTALELKATNPSAKILILERGIIPTGASTRNAGFACFGSPTEMISDAKKMGENAMWSVVEMRYKGIEKIRKNFGDISIDFDMGGGYECFYQDDNNIELINKNLDWLNDGMKTFSGIPQSFKWSNAKLQQYGFSGFGGMVENISEGGLHAGKLVQALQQKVYKAGIQIMFGVNVNSYRKVNNAIEVVANNNTFTCTNLVLATNAFGILPGEAFTVKPARGQVIVTEPIESLQMRGTFHFDEGYYYFRNVGNRVLLGGARNTDFMNEATNEFAITDNIQQKLEAFLATHILPNYQFKISHRWSGIMAFTDSKLPAIQQVEKNVISINACNGMGVALTPIIAEKVAQYFDGTFNVGPDPSSLHLLATK